MPGSFAVHALCQNLDREQIVVTVDDQPRQEIALAEHHAIGVRVLNHALAISNCRPNAVPQQTGKIVHRLARKQTKSNLRRAAVKRSAEEFTALIENVDQCAGRNPIRRKNVRAVDPDVACEEALGASPAYFHR